MTELIIKVPSIEFKNDIADKFQDYFSRVQIDLSHGKLCGNYEMETTEMLKAAFNHLEERKQGQLIYCPHCGTKMRGDENN